MICSKRVLSALLFFVVFAGMAASKDISDLRGLVLNHAKIPIYDSKQQLQVMAFVDRAVPEGKLIVGKNTVLEIIKKDTNVDHINDAWQLKYYGLDAKLPEVVKFWAPRLTYSSGVFITQQANIDQKNRRVFGTAPVYFRSPEIDLDGLGFDSNFKNRTIQVNNDVNVVLRMASSDPRKLKSGEIEKADYSFVRAYSDSLLIDYMHNQIMLVGSVKVVDRNSVLNCDRLTIFFDREEKKSKDKNASGLALEGDSSISRILADGNVVISNGEGENLQRLFADHLIYDIRVGLFTFTGDTVNPRFEQKQDVISGKKIVVYREEQQVRIVGDCMIRSAGTNGSIRQINSERGDIDFRVNKGAFIGNVRMTDSGVVISGPRANLNLASKPGKVAKMKKTPDDRMLPGGFGTSGLGGSRELNSVEFTNGIRVQDNASGKETGKLDLVADNGRYDSKGKYIDFNRNVRLLDTQMTLESGKMRILLDEKSDPKSQAGNVDRIVCTEGVKIVGKGENAGTLTAEKGVFHYKKDLLVFNDNVELVNKKSKLNCDQLDLYLKSGQPGSSVKQTGVAGVGGRDKVLTKAVATGEKVVMTDPQGTLETKELTMLFEELPKGTKPAPGMLQSGSSRVTWIACDGGVRLETVPQKGKQDDLFGKSGSKRTVVAKRSETDLKKNVAYLYEDVSIYDSTNRVDCQKMSIFAGAPAKKSSAVDPDADPFALAANEDTVPQSIMLNPQLELKRVLCEEQVVMSTVDKGKKAAAGGDTGEYLAASRTMIITSKAPKKAWLRADNHRQWCDKIICDVANDRIYGVGGTESEKFFDELESSDKAKKQLKDGVESGK